jgi:hypothetical protein
MRSSIWLNLKALECERWVGTLVALVVGRKRRAEVNYIG